MLLPFFYKTTIKTTLTEQQVRDIIVSNTITKNGKSFKDKRVKVWNKRQFEVTDKNYLYRAKFKNECFKLYRILDGERNSFNPLCFGKLYQVGNDRFIKLTFRSAIFVLIFMFIWTSGVVFGTLAIFIGSINDGKYEDALLTPIMLSPFYLGLWFFHRFGFKKEVNRALHFFDSIELIKKNGR
jgi:hypothetical protein